MSDTFPTFPLGKGTLDIIEKLQKVITLSVLHSIHIETDCGERGKARLKFENIHHYFLFTDIKKHNYCRTFFYRPGITLTKYGKASWIVTQ